MFIQLFENGAVKVVCWFYLWLVRSLALYPLQAEHVQECHVQATCRLRQPPL